MSIADRASAHRRGDRAARLLWAAPLAVGGVAAAIFLAMPWIDLAVARVFYTVDGGFIGHKLAWVETLRTAFMVFYFGTIALCLAGLLATWRGRSPWLGLERLRWLFLASCLAVGPGLVANTVFKDQWGRARPRQVVEFGGARTFTPPLLPTRQCKRNCSFVSGEASSTYVTLYAAAVLLPQWSVPLAIAGTVGGLATGLVRMAQGDHFLSDVVFAGVFMALTVLILQRLMLHDRRQD